MPQNPAESWAYWPGLKRNFGLANVRSTAARSCRCGRPAPPLAQRRRSLNAPQCGRSARISTICAINKVFGAPRGPRMHFENERMYFIHHRRGGQRSCCSLIALGTAQCAIGDVCLPKSRMTTSCRDVCRLADPPGHVSLNHSGELSERRLQCEGVPSPARKWAAAPWVAVMLNFYCGDPHERFGHIHDACKRTSASSVILLGDMEPQRPLDLELGALIDILVCVHGNHDADILPGELDRTMYAGRREALVTPPVRQLSAAHFSLSGSR